MSKDKFQLPTQKGTDLFPKAVQPPTKVTFKGVPPGSKEAHELFELYGPKISWFHRQQAQKYSLSINEVYKAHTKIDNLKMTYTNIQGQEILDIEIIAPIPEPEEPEPEPIPWDWVLVDFEYECPKYEYTQTSGEEYVKPRFYAKFIEPPRTDDETGEGQAKDWDPPRQSAEEPPQLQWGAAEYSPSVEGTTVHNDVLMKASLLLDIRNYHTYEALSWDIYAGIPPISENKPISQELVGQRFVLYDAGGFGALGPEYRSFIYRDLSEWGDDPEQFMLDVYGIEPGYADTYAYNGDSGVWATREAEYVNFEYNDDDPYVENLQVHTADDDWFDALFHGPYTGWREAGNGIGASIVDTMAAIHSDDFIVNERTKIPGDPTASLGYGRVRNMWGTFYKQYDPSIVYAPEVMNSLDPPPQAFNPDHNFYERYKFGLRYFEGFRKPVYYVEYGPVYADLETPCDVFGKAFRGNPGWQWSLHYSTPADEEWHQWETATYPERPPLSLLEENVPIVSVDETLPDTAETNYRLVKIGTVRFFQDSGGVVFVPASV